MSYATAALATYANTLGTLDHLVAKAEGHAKGEALLQARLTEDMFPLHTQIRFTLDQVVTALKRLGNLELASDDSDIATFAEQGIAGYQVEAWFAVIAPNCARTPPSILRDFSGSYWKVASVVP